MESIISTLTCHILHYLSQFFLKIGYFINCNFNVDFDDVKKWLFIEFFEVFVDRSGGG